MQIKTATTATGADRYLPEPTISGWNLFLNDGTILLTKTMRLILAGLLSAFFTLWSGSGLALEKPGAIALSDQVQAFKIASNLQVWLEPSRTATIEEVAWAPEKFTGLDPDAQHPLDSDNTLWVKLQLRQPPGSHQTWTLSIPLPMTDSVVLYQRDEINHWVTQSAGIQLPQTMWSKYSLYPEFELMSQAGTDQFIYLQIRNFRSLNVPLRLAPTQQRDAQRLGEFAVLGAMLGALLSMCLLSLIRYAEHRNPADLMASAYGLAITLTVATLNGATGTMLWSETLFRLSYTHTALLPLTMGLGLLFLRDLYAMSTRHRRYDIVLLSTGWIAIASILSMLLLDRAAAHLMITTVTLLAALVGMIGAVLSWRFRSAIGRLLVASYVLQCLAMMRLIAESWGLVPYCWELRHLTSLVMALSVPLLLYALSRATHDRKELAVRAKHLPNQDALTGLLTRAAFLKQYAKAYERVVSDGDPVAVVLISVINHEHIRQAYGGNTAELCLLRAVIKLHRVLRDVDPAGRVDIHHFALLLEGVVDKDALNQRMVQLIASGLTPVPGLEPEVNLQFQVACVLLHHNPVKPERVLDELGSLLQDMLPRTRRPIRFLEAPQTHPVVPLSNPDTP